MKREGHGFRDVISGDNPWVLHPLTFSQRSSFPRSAKDKLIDKDVRLAIVRISPNAFYLQKKPDMIAYITLERWLRKEYLLEVAKNESLSGLMFQFH